jgi:hypothetical protein
MVGYQRLQVPSNHKGHVAKLPSQNAYCTKPLSGKKTDPEAN